MKKYGKQLISNYLHGCIIKENKGYFGRVFLHRIEIVLTELKCVLCFHKDKNKPTATLERNIL